MPRRLSKPARSKAQQTAAADALDKLVSAKVERRKKGKPKRSYVTKAQRTKWLAEVDQMTKAGDLSEAKPSHLVALYIRLHGWCYGAEPDEVKGQMYSMAMIQAGKLTKEEFGGDVLDAVAFIRWVWQRAKRREAKRPDGQDVFRIGWRLMFARRDLVTDYRVEQERR